MCPPHGAPRRLARRYVAVLRLELVGGGHRPCCPCCSCAVPASHAVPRRVVGPLRCSACAACVLGGFPGLRKLRGTPLPLRTVHSSFHPVNPFVLLARGLKVCAWGICTMPHVSTLHHYWPHLRQCASDLYKACRKYAYLDLDRSGVPRCAATFDDQTYGLE